MTHPNPLDAPSTEIPLNKIQPAPKHLQTGVPGMLPMQHETPESLCDKIKELARHRLEKRE